MPGQKLTKWEQMYGHVVVEEPPAVLSLQGPLLTPQQEQEKWLCDSLETVKEVEAEMKLYIRRREQRNVWNAAAKMLAEMRTDVLAPQYYYELYLKVFDVLQVLHQFVEDEYREGCSLEEMYDVVQHTGSIVPRLYLLITVGSVAIKSGEQPAVEIMRDLVEMCKGVQHPTRGMFLRHYLLTVTKNRLPGEGGYAGSKSTEGGGGTVDETIELLLQNFKEMNWLWIRMDLKGQQRTGDQQRTQQRARRDRKELCVLVGMNIVRLAQLDGVERETYQTSILPRLLQIIVGYRESLAQQYLFEVVVQVFPDEFHLFSLEQLLAALGQLQSKVDVSAILSALLQRLGKYAELMNEGVAEAGSSTEKELLMTMFDTVKTRLDDMADATKTALQALHGGDVNTQGKDGVEGVSILSGKSKHPYMLTFFSYIKSMYSLAELALKVNPATAPQNIGLIFTGIANRLPPALEQNIMLGVGRLIIRVIECLKDPSVVLDLEGIDVLVQPLCASTRRSIALALCTACLHSPSYRISTIKLAARLFELIAPLVYDEGDVAGGSNQPEKPVQEGTTFTGETQIDEKSAEEQQLVCRVLHLLQCDDVGIQAKIMNGVRKQLTKGGPQRIVATLPTLLSMYMQLALRVMKGATVTLDPDTAEAGEEERGSGGEGKPTENVEKTKSVTTFDMEEARALCSKIFHFVHSGDGKGVLEVLAGEAPQQAFYLYLSSAATADVCELSEVIYEHFVSAFQIYEQSGVDMSEQIAMVGYAVAQLHALHSLPEETYELLATKVCQYSSKLLRKSDQSRLVALCAHLFWKKDLSQDSNNRIVECLQRALKIANHVASQQPKQQQQLFVELLNLFLHYYAGRAPGVTARHVTSLLDLAQDSLTKLKQQDDDEDNENEDEKDRSVKGETSEEVQRYYDNTIQYIRTRQEVDERWKEIGMTEGEGEAADNE